VKLAGWLQEWLGVTAWLLVSAGAAVMPKARTAAVMIQAAVCLVFIGISPVRYLGYAADVVKIEVRKVTGRREVKKEAAIGDGLNTKLATWPLPQ
jgi:hypothetical protein